MRIPARVAVACCALLPVLVACKSDPIDVGRLEERIKAAYERQVEGSTVKTVTCPDNLERKPGVTATCRLVLASGVTGTVEVEVREDKKLAWTVVGAPERG